ncbi:MAG TPA: DUF1697 domain-containing protein [Candidatus Xenobia bacterium]|nr:DUF1697 domain-containing protein [Candidatus Xenobia bacterium]
MYVALLRGINVGGHKRVSMDGLRQAFESLGFRKVSTLLASGNVVFRAPTQSRAALIRKIEAGLKRRLGHEITVLLRTPEELRALADLNPFRGIRVTPQTRLFVTFLSEKPRTRLKIPYTSADKSYRILCRTRGALCSVLTLGPQWSRNLRQMDILEKEFGKRITTRSWSTVLRLLRTASGEEKGGV